MDICIFRTEMSSAKERSVRRSSRPPCKQRMMVLQWDSLGLLSDLGKKIFRLGNWRFKLQKLQPPHGAMKWERGNVVVP